jgi:hypothetical protein
MINIKFRIKFRTIVPFTRGTKEEQKPVGANETISYY